MSIIIPTFNRPIELENCLRSILDQTQKPDEIIVIDDGELPNPPLEKKFKAAGIVYIYHKKYHPGLTESRNQGVKLANADLIFFLDDDVVLCPDYIEEIVKPFMTAKEKNLGGVGGAIANPKPLTLSRRLRYIYNLLFLNSGLKEGKALPSGFCTDFHTTIFPLKKITPVDFLPGGVCAYKKEVFEEFRFSDSYRTFGFGEDKDFSYQVSTKYSLVMNPKARLYHYESQKMRPDKFVWGQKFVMGRYLFFSRYLRKNRWSILFFFYAVWGYFLRRLTAAIITCDKENARQLRGIMKAVKNIITGRVQLLKS